MQSLIAVDFGLVRLEWFGVSIEAENTVIVILSTAGITQFCLVSISSIIMKPIPFFWIGNDSCPHKSFLSGVSFH